MGQTCLFFGAANKDTNGNPVDKPEMYFYGGARLNVLRSGIEGDQLIFDPVVVSDYLRKLYLFLNVELPRPNISVAQSSSSNGDGASQKARIS
jgi:hypothetical protein